MIDVGLVGFGFAGRTFHAPVISAVEGLRLAAIVQRKGTEAQQAYPGAQIVRSVDELLSLESVRVVVIATPNTSHFPIAKQCLLAGRDVVVDKPFTPTCKEAAELVALARQNGRIISVYQNRRWDGDFQTLQRLVSEGNFGQVVLFESHFDRFRPHLKENAWRESSEPGSGLLFDLGPHLIDQAMLLFGEPSAVSGDVRIEREGAVVDDAFDVVLHYPDKRALLRAGVLVSTQTPRFVVQGTKGGYLKYGLDPQEDALKRGETPQGEYWGYEAPERWGTLFTLQGDAFVTEKLATAPGDYRRYYENVRDAVLGKSELAVTPAQALRVMRALELAAESSRTGRLLRWQP
jgi:predicted dehydrogenase